VEDAKALLDRQDYEGALAMYSVLRDRMDRRDPSWGPVQAVVGFCCSRLGRHTGAIAAYSAAIANDQEGGGGHPDLHIWHMNRGTKLLAEGVSPPAAPHLLPVWVGRVGWVVASSRVRWHSSSQRETWGGSSPSRQRTVCL
jgi:hypothetical protein